MVVSVVVDLILSNMRNVTRTATIISQRIKPVAHGDIKQFYFSFISDIRTL